ncbi:MAG: divergent PAP2 family protein [bacterium]|nr:divergent PAP2 family protein [bacterium]
MTIPLFLIPIVAALTAQALKPVFSKAWRDDQATQLDPRPRYGGMPSAHASFATSLALTVLFTEGVTSAAFAIAAVIFILVFDDALRLRIFLGRYGLAIRRLLEQDPAAAQGLPPIEWRMGHTLPEVLVGTLVGLLCTVLILALDSGF